MPAEKFLKAQSSYESRGPLRVPERASAPGAVKKADGRGPVSHSAARLGVDSVTVPWAHCRSRSLTAGQKRLAANSIHEIRQVNQHWSGRFVHRVVAMMMISLLAGRETASGCLRATGTRDRFKTMDTGMQGGGWPCFRGEPPCSSPGATFRLCGQSLGSSDSPQA